MAILERMEWRLATLASCVHLTMNHYQETFYIFSFMKKQIHLGIVYISVVHIFILGLEQPPLSFTGKVLVCDREPTIQYLLITAIECICTCAFVMIAT